MERNNPSAVPHGITGIIPVVIRSAQRGSFSLTTVHPLRYFSAFILAVGILFLSSCSSSLPASKRKAPVVKKTPPVTITVATQLLPEGWADITARAKQPQILQWIVNRNYSATMVLKALHTDSVTFGELSKEEMNVVAEISLRGKVPQNDADFRVTRVPTVTDTKRKFSSYAYSERGLLRRVVVFRKQNRFMELELLQEQSGTQFDEMSNDLLQFAGMLYDR